MRGKEEIRGLAIDFPQEILIFVLSVNRLAFGEQ